MSPAHSNNLSRPQPLQTEASLTSCDMSVALLTGGRDRPYVFGLSLSLISHHVALDLIGSDELDLPEFQNQPNLTFLKLRSNHPSQVPLSRKITRVATYYARLLSYATHAKPHIFHILWNNKFEWFDRTFLMLYYKLLGKAVVMTLHNVNTARRDDSDTRLNRITLRMQYRLSDHIFVHTEKMRHELTREYGVKDSRVTTIPFGINNAIPQTTLTLGEAKKKLGIGPQAKTILFFGRITPYKGLEYLIEAYQRLATEGNEYRLIIAGEVDPLEKRWPAQRQSIQKAVASGQVLLRDEFIPDAETEVYFKAADVLVLPYKAVYQSGVLFLAHSFGLPVLAADVGSLTDDIVEGRTGFAFRPEDSGDLARVIQQYFSSDLYRHLDSRRNEIRDFATERHSWRLVAEQTVRVYANLLQKDAAVVALLKAGAPGAGKKLVTRSGD